MNRRRPIRIRAMTLLPAMLLVPGLATAQEVFSSGSGEGSSGNDRMSWTLGEPISGTVSDATHVLTQGFEQPWAVITTVLSGNEDAGPGINVFPNPVRTTLHVVYEQAVDNDRIELVDARGRLLHQEQVQGTTLDLDMTNYLSGAYFLRIHDAQGMPRQTFQISVTR